MLSFTCSSSSSSGIFICIGIGRCIYCFRNGTRVLHPLHFFNLEDTAGIIIAVVSARMTPSSILSERLTLC